VALPRMREVDLTARGKGTFFGVASHDSRILFLAPPRPPDRRDRTRVARRMQTRGIAAASRGGPPLRSHFQTLDNPVFAEINNGLKQPSNRTGTG